MIGIRSVRSTSLFWETLEAGGLRNHRRYRDIRAAIEQLVIRKHHSLDPIGKRDSKFSSANKYLSGIWHCALSWEPDTVLFYTIEDRVLSLSMIGSHDDYPHAGGKLAIAERTANRIRAAVAGGDVPSPQWRSIAWRRPSDLLAHPELYEASSRALDSIATTLEREAQTAEIFSRIHGIDVTEADIETFEDWFDEVRAASVAVHDAMSAKPVTGEERLRRLVETGSPWAMAV